MGNNGNNIRFIPEAMERMNGLISCRMKLGLSLKELSQRSGVSIRGLRKYEQRVRYPTIRNYNVLARIFEWESIKERVRPKYASASSELRQKRKKYEVVEIGYSDAEGLPKPVSYTFQEGHVYQLGADKRESSSTGYKPDNDGYKFYYEGKQGIHHVFREVIGGWITTRTDAQLIGEKIQEVAS